MTTALAVLNKHKNVLLIDVVLLTALYLVPTFSHLTAWPLYKLEPMRLVLLAALLFTNRTNTYLLAFTIPLASSWLTGHPVPFKALLMAIELSILVATYSYLIRWKKLPAFAALAAGIIVGKFVYYNMKFVALGAGWLSGSLISTPWQNQLILALGTAAVFAVVEKYQGKQR